jgi:pyruvate formate lyase activating enzyme
MKATIFDIKRFAVHDGEGIRTTIFFKGCPLSCIWCHNPESIYGGKDIWVIQENCINCKKCLQCPENAIDINDDGYVNIDKNKCTFCNLCIELCPTNCISRIDRQISIEEAIEEVLKDKKFHQVSNGGVTLSGGEPLLQKDFVLKLLKELKDIGVSTCVDTSLYCAKETLKQAIKHTDIFLVDIKLMDESKHIKYVGKSNKQILENFKYLAKNTPNIVVRIPLIPQITATYENISEITKFVTNLNSNIAIDLLNYNILGNAKYARLKKECECCELKPLSDEELENMKSIVREFGGINA